MGIDDRMRLLDSLTERIMLVGHIQNKELANEIARRWIKG
jgi:hypothetical protein